MALLCGITLSVAAFGKVMLIDRMLLGNTAADASVALVVGLTLAVTVLVAKLIGCTLPLLAKCLKLDPAVMASPFITTIVDAVSLLVYFAVASLLASDAVATFKPRIRRHTDLQENQYKNKRAGVSGALLHFFRRHLG